MLLPQEIIRKKRDGGRLAAAEIAFMVEGLSSGRLADSQVGALAMAIFFRGMSREETVALTLAMRASGTVLDWRSLDRPVVDKHSTGGIGDKTSLILAPLLAACGAAVPMLSGRGLGHTGGTLDKLDSIPGYRSQPGLDLFRRTVRRAGCAIIGQTADLAPADRRLYAIRDVTATVESIPLITASILSKKLAAAPQALVMDVKTGSGAFMPERDRAEALAKSIAEVATGAGLPCRSLLTDMGQCLGTTAGNAVELLEAIAMLKGRPTEPRLAEVTLALAAELLDLAGLAASVEEGRRMAERALASGAAAEHFARMVVELGGPADLLDHPQLRLPVAPLHLPVPAPTGGHVGAIDARALGLAIIALGGGRVEPTAAIDHAVGLTEVVGIGQEVEPGDPLALIHARDPASAAEAAATIEAAYTIGTAPVAPPKPILLRMAG